MSRRSAIEWTEMTWNPVSGCTKVSPGCANCYAERMAKRLKAMGAARYRDGFALRMHEAALQEPLHWKSPRKVFVNSMSDLFHKDVPLEFIQRAFHVIEGDRMRGESRRIEDHLVLFPVAAGGNHLGNAGHRQQPAAHERLGHGSDLLR